jgi:hypothetical protein
MSAKTKQRARQRAQRQRDIDEVLKDLAESFSYTTTTAGDWTYGSQWETYTQAGFEGLDLLRMPGIPLTFHQSCTRGRTMRPSHLFGKCVCHVCKLAEFAGLSKRRRNCVTCGFCMFLLCPNAFELAWNWEVEFNRGTYSCTVDSRESASCLRRRRETCRFMLWLCWTRKRRNVSGLGKLPRDIIKIIAKLMA